MSNEEPREQYANSREAWQQLSVPMPTEALSVDNSRGFPLTSIKAGFVIERLTQVFGTLGYGWRYAVGPFSIETAGGKEEVLVQVILQWRATESESNTYCPPIYWRKKVDIQSGMIIEGWMPLDISLPAVWSEPVFATGGSSAKRKGSTPLNDAHRAATTNALTKAASRMGVALEIFKGQDDLVGNSSDPGRRQRSGQRSRQSGPATPSKPARAPKAKGGEGYAGLEAIQEAVKAAMAKLTIADSDEPAAKTVQSLAHKMDGLGIKMQPVRLVHLLLGEGGFTLRAVMATVNILNSGKLSQANIELLNQEAFENSI